MEIKQQHEQHDPIIGQLIMNAYHRVGMVLSHDHTHRGNKAYKVEWYSLPGEAGEPMERLFFEYSLREYIDIYNLWKKNYL